MTSSIKVCLLLKNFSHLSHEHLSQGCQHLKMLSFNTGTYCSHVVKENVEFLVNGGFKVPGEADRRQQKAIPVPKSGDDATGYHWYMTVHDPNMAEFTDNTLNLVFLAMEELRHRATNDLGR